MAKFGKDAKGMPLMANADVPRVRAVRNTSGVARVAGEVVIWQTAATWSRAAYTAAGVLNRTIAAATEATMAGYDITTTTDRGDPRVAGMLLTDIAIDGEGVMLEFGETPASEATIYQAGESSVSLSAVELRVRLEIGEAFAIGTRVGTAEIAGMAGPLPAGAEPGSQLGYVREALAAAAAVQGTVAVPVTVPAFINVQ